MMPLLNENTRPGDDQPARHSEQLRALTSSAIGRRAEAPRRRPDAEDAAPPAISHEICAAHVRRRTTG